MKNTLSVFILLFGMISLTSVATTPLMDQKQKKVFDSEPSFQIEALNVVEFNVINIDNFISYDNEKLQMNKEVVLFVNRTRVTKPMMSIKDIGWQGSSINYNSPSTLNNPQKHKRIPFGSINMRDNIRNCC